MTTLQVVSIASVAVFLFFIVRMVRAGKLRAKYSFLWLMVGSVILAFSAVPGLMETTAGWLGILYPPAMLFLGAIALLLFVAVHFSWELTRIEARTRTLTEELALTNARLRDLEQAAPGPTDRRSPYLKA